MGTVTPHPQDCSGLRSLLTRWQAEGKTAEAGPSHGALQEAGSEPRLRQVLRGSLVCTPPVSCFRGKAVSKHPSVPSLPWLCAHGDDRNGPQPPSAPEERTSVPLGPAKGLGLCSLRFGVVLGGLPLILWHIVSLQSGTHRCCDSHPLRCTEPHTRRVLRVMSGKSVGRHDL